MQNGDTTDVYTNRQSISVCNGAAQYAIHDMKTSIALPHRHNTRLRSRCYREQERFLTTRTSDFPMHSSFQSQVIDNISCAPLDKAQAVPCGWASHNELGNLLQASTEDNLHALLTRCHTHTSSIRMACKDYHCCGVVFKHCHSDCNQHLENFVQVLRDRK